MTRAWRPDACVLQWSKGDIPNIRFAFKADPGGLIAFGTGSLAEGLYSARRTLGCSLCDFFFEFEDERQERFSRVSRQLPSGVMEKVCPVSKGVRMNRMAPQAPSTLHR